MKTKKSFKSFSFKASGRILLLLALIAVTVLCSVFYAPAKVNAGATGREIITDAEGNEYAIYNNVVNENKQFLVEDENGNSVNMTNFNQMSDGDSMYVMVLHNDGSRFLSFDHFDQGSSAMGGNANQIVGVPLDASYFRTTSDYPWMIDYYADRGIRTHRFYWKMVCHVDSAGNKTFTFDEYHNEAFGDATSRFFVNGGTSSAETVGQEVAALKKGANYVENPQSNGDHFTISYADGVTSGVKVNIAPAVYDANGKLTSSGTVVGLKDYSTVLTSNVEFRAGIFGERKTQRVDGKDYISFNTLYKDETITMSRPTLFSNAEAESHQWYILPMLQNRVETTFGYSDRNYGATEPGFDAVIYNPYNGYNLNHNIGNYNPDLLFASSYSTSFGAPVEISIGTDYLQQLYTIKDARTEANGKGYGVNNERHMLWEILTKQDDHIAGNNDTYTMDVHNYSSANGTAVGFSRDDSEAYAQRFLVFYSMEENGCWNFGSISGTKCWDSYAGVQYDGKFRAVSRVSDTGSMVLQEFDPDSKNQDFGFRDMGERYPDYYGEVNMIDVFDYTGTYTIEKAEELAKTVDYKIEENVGPFFRANTKTNFRTYVDHGFYTVLSAGEEENYYIGSDGLRIKKGFKPTGRYTSVNAYDGAICYRFVEPITYTVTYNRGTGTDNNVTAPSTHIYNGHIWAGASANTYTYKGNTYDLDLTPENFYKEYVISLIENNIVENTVDDTIPYIWNFAGWKNSSGDTFTDGQILADNLTYEDGATIELVAQWEDVGVDLPTPERYNHAFFGWSLKDSYILSSDIHQGKVTGIENNTTTYHAYWVGADFSGIREQRGDITYNTKEDLSVGINVYNLDTIQSNVDVSADTKYSWYRNDGLVSVEVFAPIVSADGRKYNVTYEDRGCAIKAEAYYKDAPFGYAFSAVIPSNVRVDIEPSEGSYTNHFPSSSIVIANGSKAEVNNFVYRDGDAINNSENVTISSVVSKLPANVSYKVYGVWGTERALLFSSKEEGYETEFHEDVGVSRKGAKFDSYVVEIENKSGASLTVSEENLVLVALPEVYTVTTSGTHSVKLGYLNSGKYIMEERAIDGKGNLYFYGNDSIRVAIPVANDKKLAAGSYIQVNGSKVFQTYAVPVDGYVVYDYLNELDYYLNRADKLAPICVNNDNMFVNVSASFEANVEENKHNLNVGPLGIKLNTEDDRKIRFGTVWYFDDIATENSWSRRSEKGTNLVLLKNILYSTENNDFYAWLVSEKGLVEADSIRKDWNANYSKKTEAEKDAMLVTLKEFVLDWNKVFAENPDRKLNLGKNKKENDVVNNVPADCYYYVQDGEGRVFMEFSAILSIPEGMEAQDIVYFPYASYVYNWTHGYFAPFVGDWNKNVYVYKEPMRVYNHNAVTSTLTIPDMVVGEGSTIDISNIFTNGIDTEVVYVYEKTNAITIENGKITAHIPDEIVKVTAYTKYHVATFNVRTIGALKIEDKVMGIGNSVQINPEFTDGRIYDVTYEFDENYLSIVDGVITSKAEVEETLVTAITEHHRITFKVRVTGLRIDDVEIVNGTTVTLEPDFQNNVVETITYTYDTEKFGNALSFDGNSMTANKPGLEIVVTATSNTFKTTFTVKTFGGSGGIKFDSNIYVYDYVNDVYENPTTDLAPQFHLTDFAGKTDLTYVVHDNQGIIIDSKTNTAKAAKDAVEGAYTVDVYYKNHKYGIITITVVKVNENDTSKYNNKYDSWNNEYSNDWNIYANDGKTTLFIGDSFFDPVDQNGENGYWTDFYTGPFVHDDARLLGMSASTTYDWERIVYSGWLKYTQKSPKNIILHIGTNNTGDLNEDAETAFKAIQRLSLALHERFPEANIYWFQISDRFDGMSDRNSRNDEINAAMSTWCGNRDWITCLETTYPLDSTLSEDGIHPAPGSYYIFTQAVGLNVDVLPKDISYKVDQKIDDSTGTTKLVHTGWTLGKHGRYVISGTLDITAIAKNSHIEFAFNSSGTERILLWDYKNTGEFALCFEGMESQTPYIYKFDSDTGLTLEWKIVFANDDIYFFIKDDQSEEYDLALVRCNLERENVSDALVLGSENTECTFRDMSICFEAHSYMYPQQLEEYRAELKVPYVYNSIRTYNTDEDCSVGKHIVFSEPESKVTTPSTTGFEKGKWIWRNGGYMYDEYAEFYFEFEGKENVEMKISADSNYAVYINGELAVFSQYPDYPYYKIYDTVDISKYCTDGINKCGIIVYYCGDDPTITDDDTSTYYPSVPGLIFEVSSNDEIVAFSNENVMSRLSTAYANKAKKQISKQLGFSFKYSMANEDNWLEGELNGFSESVYAPKKAVLYPRATEKTVLEDRVESNVEKSQFIGSDGKYHYMFDLEKETVGFIDFSITSSVAQSMKIVYGEKLVNNEIPNNLWARDFSVEIDLIAGDNVYMNPFLRLGCRYLEVITDSAVTINYVSVRPVVYPVTVLEPTVELTEERQTIYDISVHTLMSCMHEHYEDTPWREQAMYAMDTRNQMLCGYYAFREYKFARASIVLMSKSVTHRGLMTITAPNGTDSYIPSFSLHYIYSVAEYIEHSGDEAVLAEIWDSLETIISTFVDLIDGTGLIPVFDQSENHDDVFWDFYEWSYGMAGFKNDSKFYSGLEISNYDLALNAMLIMALEDMSEFCNILGKEDVYSTHIQGLRNSINSEFYNASNGLYKNDDVNTNQYSQLANSLAILCGAATGDRALAIADKVANNISLTEASLSMQCFVYDALLEVNRAGYTNYILEHIDEDYGTMVDAGATTFWETLDLNAFGDATSLCHGWSAMPVYYYSILLPQKS